MKPEIGLNRQLNGFCMRFLARPTHHFDRQDGIPDECWEGPGYYLLRVEQDGAELLGQGFDEAWARAQALKVEAEASAQEAQHQIERAKKVRRRGEAFDDLRSFIGGARALLDDVDGLLDRGVEKVKQLAEGVELGRELLGRDDDGDGGA